ncbi:unnamed protein product [Allacma fusca]|uniref:CRAL-TRIO domain-containing protein n=1 Tax=Allacma fusca TaxID=39272 RepID=A0A8J2NPW2_9HEXA|nr:unnamed protein product [Allacma fusca]
MDRVKEMSPQEADAMREFKKRIPDLMPKFKNDFFRNDLSLLRFLRARDLHLDRSEKMLRNHLKWREENHVNEILEAKIPINFFEDFPVKICGRDRKGHLVAAAQIGKWDFRSMVDAGLKDDFIWFVVQWIERGAAISDQMSTDETYYTQACIIFDFEGFSYMQLASKAFISMILDLIKVFEANYPEALCSIWVINTPSIFSIFWGIIKPFISERTTSKIRIFGCNKNKWRADIVTMIDEDNFPSLYSGANTTCPNFRLEVGLDAMKLSPSYKVYPKEDMTQVVVSPGQLYTVEVHAGYGMEINWNFCTDKFDIMFRVDFEDDEIVLEPCRVDSHLCVQKGRMTCERKGLYTLVFDNTYSSYTGKSLRYIVWTIRDSRLQYCIYCILHKLSSNLFLHEIVSSSGKCVRSLSLLLHLMNAASALSDEEVTVLCQFRKQAQNILPLLKNDFMRHDLSLIRFLRARNLNIVKAENLLRQHIVWRQKNNIDNILSVHLPPDFQFKYPVTACGYCRDGFPVVAFNAGRWNFREVVESGQEQTMMMYLERFFELFLELCSNMSTSEKYFTEFNVIVDLDGLELLQIASKEVREFGPRIVEMFIANYPELLRCAWIINAPTIFQFVWAIIRPLLTDRTASKIQILGSNRNTWRDNWIKRIDPDNIPSQYGGAITSCLTFKYELGWDVLNTYEVFPERELQKLVLNAGQDHTVEFLLQSGQRLTWNFRTDDYDIGFSVSLKTESEPLNIIGYSRLDSHLFLQKGTFLCEVDGTYSLCFHNSFSKFTAKALMYGCRITSAGIK